MRNLIALLIFVCAALPALSTRAEQVVAGFSHDTISITTNFSGSEILIYGAVRREAPIAQDNPLAVVVTVAGPSRPVTMRRKERVAGIWINRAAAQIDAAPTFYAVATSAPYREAVSGVSDALYSISLPRAFRNVQGDAEHASSFLEALRRLRMDDGLYQIKENTVDLREDTLFSTAIALPANLIEGDYKVRIFLTRAGRVINVHESTIAVRKVGIERAAFRLAHEQPLLYGLLALIVAISVGWLVSALFRMIRA